MSESPAPAGLEDRWIRVEHGRRALAAAAKIRRNLNLLWLDGKLSEAEAERLLLRIKETLRTGLLDQDQLLRLTAS